MNSSEFHQLANNRVKSEKMKLELNESLEVWVGKEVTATLKANGLIYVYSGRESIRNYRTRIFKTIFRS